MKLLRRLRQAPPAFFKAVAICVLAQWVLALGMVASPELHECLHEDAHHEEHECVVTHMLAGDFGEVAPPALITIGPASPLGELVIADGKDAGVRPLCLDNGVLEHAPPVAV